MDHSTYLKPTKFFDYHSPEIQYLIEEFNQINNKQLIIKQLYLKIRDGWRYNAFKIGLKAAHFKASNIAQKPEGHCIDKAILYIAGLRALGIPARIHLAKVSNHIATERLEKILGTNELTPHGLVDVYYNNQWVKCSPAFNKELCDMYNVDVLEFDGTEDSVMQEYNNENKKFMTYLEDYGSFEDVPVDFILNTLKENYPDIIKQFEGAEALSF